MKSLWKKYQSSQPAFDQGRFQGKGIGKCLILLICLFSLVLALACPDIRAEGADKRIRLAWLKRSSLNPLETFDFSGQAAMQLIYRGLFMIDDAEMLRTDLAEEANWSPDHYQLTIKLRKDVSFSDRTPLTSRDAALSILYYRYYLQQKLQRDAIPPQYVGTESADQYLTPLPPPTDFLRLADNPGPTDQAQELVAEGEDDQDQEVENTEGQVGQVFTADAQAAYLNELPADPWGIEAYEAIESIEIIDKYTFRIDLAQRAERLPWYLCLPIIPEPYLESHGLTPIPGIGSYKFSKAQDEAGTSWELKPVSTRQQAPGLSLKAYDDFDAALADFNEDRLDLLLVPAAEYLNLRHRQGLKAVAAESLDYYLLLAGSDRSYPMADPQVFRAFRQAQLLSSQDLAAHSYLNFPHRASDWRQAYAVNIGSQESQVPDLSEARLRLSDHKVTLAAVSSPSSRSLLAEIKQMFLLSSSQLDMVWLQEDELANFAAAGHYDLLLLELPLSLPTDLRTLTYELNRLVPDLQLRLPDLAADGLLPPAYFYAWDLDKADIPLQALESSYRALSFALERSRVLGLGFADQALLLGSRLDGNLAAPAWDPYRHITEVTLCP